MDNMEEIREVFNKGYDAYSDGLSEDQNPYNKNEFGYESWKAGFKVASQIEDEEGQVPEL